MSRDVRKIYNKFQNFRKNLDESLYRDKGIKINHYYELSEQFNRQDLKELKKSIDNMIIDIRQLMKEC